MDEFLQSFGQRTWLPFSVIAGRLLLAAILGAVVGFERESRNRPAGLRTHILVCLTTAAIAILTIEITHLSVFSGQEIRIDPIWLVKATTAGVAFLAAGLIFFAKGEVPWTDYRRRDVAGGRNRFSHRARKKVLADRKLCDAPDTFRARITVHITGKS